MYFYSFQKCAYHPNHLLKLFCKCTQCLLPACQVCVRIHKNEHKMYATNPEFENAEHVYKKVYQQYQAALKQLQRLKKQFDEISPSLKINQEIVKSIFKQKRIQMIENFEKMIFGLQEQFISNLFVKKQKLLLNIEILDSRLANLQKTLKNKLYNFQESTTQRWNIIIEYYSQNSKDFFNNQLTQVQNSIIDLKNTKLTLNIEKLNIFYDVVGKTIWQHFPSVFLVS